MKKLFLLTLAMFSVFSELAANPGDTTWVTIYNQRKITAYGNIDTTATLPTGKRYRKIRLHYILGRYACPAGSQYCGSWDYTTQVYVKPAGMDTVEIARIITPYATDWLGSGVNKKHDYIVDVTDYAAALQGTNLGFRYGYQGYSWGFTVTLKLEMIEGVPPMDALSVKNIYDGYYAYGVGSDPIESHLVQKTFQYAAPAANAIIKNTISGHGSDNAGCSEFCSKYYEQKVNGTSLGQRQLWRKDCGMNDVYPQTGTWLFERGNWCPGAVVWPIYHNITTNTSAGSNFTVDMDMEPFTSPGGTAGGYNVVSQLIAYSAINHSTDVAIEDVIAPTNDENYFRSNSICSNPKVKIRNVGSNAVTSVSFLYNLKGGTTQTYTWNGNLPFLKDTVVDLGSSVNVFNANTSNVFEVKVTGVNGGSGDDYADNNVYTTTFTDVRSYPGKFVVYLKTNNATSTTNAGFNETHWQIINDQGTVMYSRTNANNNTTYNDTVTLPTGCYSFILDDDGCDGINWWYYQYYNVNPGTGIVRFSPAVGIPPLKTFNGDFGCQVIERFTVNYVLSTNDLQKMDQQVTLFPNPASNELNLLFDVTEKQDITYTITDVTGKQLLQGLIPQVSSVAYPVNTTSLASGVYMISLTFKNGSTAQKRFVIGR